MTKRNLGNVMKSPGTNTPNGLLVHADYSSVKARMMAARMMAALPSSVHHVINDAIENEAVRLKYFDIETVVLTECRRKLKNDCFCELYKTPPGNHPSAEFVDMSRELIRRRKVENA